MGRKVRRRDGGATGQRVVLGQEGIGGEGEEGQEIEVRGNLEVVGEGDVDRGVAQRLDQAGVVVFGLAEVDGGMGGGEAGRNDEEVRFTVFSPPDLETPTHLPFRLRDHLSHRRDRR